MTINIGDNYRLRRFDRLSWVLEERRVKRTRGGGEDGEEEPRWFSAGRYFTRLDAAVRCVYEWRLLEDDGEYDLFEAIRRAEAIAHELAEAVGKELPGE